MSGRIAKWVAGTLGVVVLLGMSAGCGQQTPKEKTVIKILYTNNFKQVESLIESTYDDIDLQVETSLYSSEQLRRLERGVGPDLVIAAQPDSALVQEYLLDISDTRASTAYDGTIMNAFKQDGKTYLIPLPGVYSGYIVNETLFEQAGLSIPESNAELAAALAALKAQGLGVGEDGINFSIMSDYNASVGMFMVGYMVPDFLGTAEGVKWLAGFREKKTTFTGLWERSFSLLSELAEAGVLDPADIARQRNSVRYQQRLSNGTLAAVFSDSTLYFDCVAGNREAVAAGTAEPYAYRMLPLLSDEGNEPWFLFSPSALLGVNNAVSREKQDACKRILALLSTPAGQDALLEDLGAGMSCLIDYQQQETLIPAGVEEYLESGYIYNVLFPGKTVEFLGGYARNVMTGKCTVEEALEATDRFYYDGTDESYDFTVVGSVSRDLLFADFNVRRRETELGNFIADCVAEASGAPIAVVNGGSIRASFYEGVVYGGDIAMVCPYDNRIVVLEMDGQTLWDMLENGLSTCTDEFPGGRFLQVAGLHYTFDSGSPAGRRLMSVTLPGGAALDRTASYRVAVTDYMAGSKTYAEGNGDGYTMLNCYDDAIPKGGATLARETGLTYRDALAQYFERHQGVAVDAELEGRIRDLKQEQ